MSTSPVWDKIFSSNRRWNKYPPEELIRFFSAYYYQVEPRSEVKVLEIGCGPGGGASQYVSKEGFNFFGIDGSKVAIERAKEIFSDLGLKGSFSVADIQKLPFKNEIFDSVFDVCCLQHNSEIDSAVAIAEVWRVLKPGGWHFSLTARTGSWGESTGERIDSTTIRNPVEGPYVGMDVVRYTTEKSLRSLYKKFEDVKIEYSVRSAENQKHEIGHWQVHARKPN